MTRWCAIQKPSSAAGPRITEESAKIQSGFASRKGEGCFLNKLAIKIPRKFAMFQNWFTPPIPDQDGEGHFPTRTEIKVQQEVQQKRRRKRVKTTRINMPRWIFKQERRQRKNPNLFRQLNSDCVTSRNCLDILFFFVVGLNPGLPIKKKQQKRRPLEDFL